MKSFNKQFNKVNFMQSIGLLDARVYYAPTFRFEKSWYLIVRSKLILLVNVSETLRFCISPMFERESLIQLYIGSPYNAFTGATRLFAGYTVSGRLISYWTVSYLGLIELKTKYF